MKQQFLEMLRHVALIFPAFLLVATCRGFGKALMAKVAGDDTPERTGFLTLNPVAHVDIANFIIFFVILVLIGSLVPGTGSLSLIFILAIAMGARWSYPVPYNQNNFSNLNLGVSMTLLAGPVSSFLLSLIFMYMLKYLPFAMLPVRLTLPLIQICQSVSELALFLGVFDMIPLPPFDGGYLLIHFLPESLLYIARFLEEYSLFILLALFFVPGLREAFLGILALTSSVVGQFLHMLVI